MKDKPLAILHKSLYPKDSLRVMSIVDDCCRFLTAGTSMTYKHKKEKCAKETKEILEDVLLAKEEDYGCLNCVESVSVSSPVEKMLAEESQTTSVKPWTESLIEEAAERPEEVTINANGENHEDYSPVKQPTKKRIKDPKELYEKDNKNRAYIESKKDYKG